MDTAAKSARPAELRPPAGHSPFEEPKIEALYMRDEGLCHICAGHVAFHEACIEHVYPRSHGGKNCYHNTALAHRACNSAKSNRLPDPLPATCGCAMSVLEAQPLTAEPPPTDEAKTTATPRRGPSQADYERLADALARILAERWRRTHPDRITNAVTAEKGASQC